MASTTGPDLTTAVIKVEELMDDSCVIYATSDAGEVFNSSTGEVEVDLGDVIYDASSVSTVDGESLADDEATGGRCKVSPSIQDLTPSQTGEQTGTLELFRFYKFAVPIDAPLIPIGATVVVQSSRRDPRLVGAQLRVRELIRSTFAVQQKMLIEMRDATE